MVKQALRLLGVCVVVGACAPALGQVDVQATRAYLRSGVNSGSEVTTPAPGQEVFVHVDYLVEGGSAPFTARVRALIGPSPCVGDCDDGGTVVVSELITGVNIALERSDLEQCDAFDRDSNGQVAVNELVAGVDNLLRGCALTEHCSGSLEFEPDSDRVIWCPEAVIAEPGTYVLRWELDTENQVTETNETNNAAQTTFTTAADGSRDLEALRFYLATEPNGDTEVDLPTLDQPVYLHIEYRVGGSGTAFDADVEAKIDGQSFCGGPIRFTPGVDGIVWCPQAWNATAGDHTLQFELDPNDAIDETNETNNVATSMFSVGGL